MDDTVTLCAVRGYNSKVRQKNSSDNSQILPVGFRRLSGKDKVVGRSRDGGYESIDFMLIFGVIHSNVDSKG